MPAPNKLMVMVMSEQNEVSGLQSTSTDEAQSLSEFNRLAWHSRRGMLELDVLLIPFLNEAYRDLSPEDQRRYKNLLDCEDPDLFSWFMRHAVPDNPDHLRMVNMILDRVQPD
jgi:antitoxin CptB